MALYINGEKVIIHSGDSVWNLELFSTSPIVNETLLKTKDGLYLLDSEGKYLTVKSE